MYRLLVTGIDALIGYGILHALKACHYPVYIYGIDTNPTAIGRKWCDQFIEAIPISSDDYPDFMYELLLKYDIDLVIPGFEADCNQLSSSMERFKNLKTIFVLNSTELLNIANDKWLTHQALINFGLPTIPSYIYGDYKTLQKKLGCPYLVKPRISHASRGVHIIKSQYEHEFWKEQLADNFLAQQIVGTNTSEYTTAVFGFGDGTTTKPIMFRRLLGSGGSTVEAHTVKNPKLEKIIRQMSRVFKPEGPTNFQFRLHKDIFYPLEINARISSTISIRTAFGFNDANMCIEYYLLNKKPQANNLKTGRAKRYLQDMIDYDSNNI